MHAKPSMVTTVFSVGNSSYVKIFPIMQCIVLGVDEQWYENLQYEKEGRVNDLQYWWHLILSS